jgi:hypothetical protein
MHYEYESDDSHNLRSGKRYKVDHGHQFEHRRSHISEPRVKSPHNLRKKRNFIPLTPQKSFVNPPSASQNSPRGHSPPPIQNTQPPRRNRMGDDMKLPIFKGTRLEDLEQHWFLCDAMWSVKQVVDDAIKMAKLTTTFRDRALKWFMKYSNGQVRTLLEVKVAMIAEFKKPKSESQCITELKEIKQKPNESVWEFDQKIKTLLSQVSFNIDAQQHREWFIAALLPHIRLSLMQQKVASQAEALEIAMKLEASPIAETIPGMVQIHNQLSNLTLQLQDMQKGNKVREEVWCTKCRTEGHSKEHCPVNVEYMASGAPNLLPQE